jgi:hypothetical protein
MRQSTPWWAVYVLYLLISLAFQATTRRNATTISCFHLRRFGVRSLEVGISRRTVSLYLYTPRAVQQDQNCCLAAVEGPLFENPMRCRSSQHDWPSSCHGRSALASRAWYGRPVGVQDLFPFGRANLGDSCQHHVPQLHSTCSAVFYWVRVSLCHVHPSERSTRRWGFVGRGFAK